MDWKCWNVINSVLRAYSNGKRADSKSARRGQTRVRVQIPPLAPLICRVDREADGARLESELSEIRHTGSNPVPYAIYIVAHSKRSL